MGADVKVAGFLPGTALLIEGRYAEAWPLYDGREHRLKVLRAMGDWPEWQGQDLTGKGIFIWGEQGIGDEVMLSRFLSHLRRRGAIYIAIACLSVNERLFQALGADRTINRQQDPVPLPDVHYWAMLGSLPRWLGVTPETLRGDAYIGIDLPAAGVGVAWRGNPQNPRDHIRSLPTGDRLLEIPGARELVPHGDTVDSLAQVAACEMVVTVDTAWAHMAGALGKRTCVLLPTGPGLDWRWGREGTRTPWYRTARLYRQSRRGEWRDVIDRVMADLT